MVEKLRPDNYSNGRGPNSGDATDLLTAFSGNAHYNTMQENVKSKRSTSNMDPSDNDAIVSTTHRDPEPAMDPNDK